jgi:HD superfamily phosphohydrolase
MRCSVCRDDEPEPRYPLPNRLMSLSRICENQIVYSYKETFNLYELFHTRYSLFKRIYTHKVAKAVEYMIVDALLAADSFMDISGAVDDMERYTYMTDSILKEIEKSKADVSGIGKSSEGTVSVWFAKYSLILAHFRSWRLLAISLND